MPSSFLSFTHPRSILDVLASLPFSLAGLCTGRVMTWQGQPSLGATLRFRLWKRNDQEPSSLARGAHAMEDGGCTSPNMEGRKRHAGRGEDGRKNKPCFQTPVDGLDWTQMYQVNIEAGRDGTKPKDLEKAIECVAYKDFRSAFGNGCVNDDARKLLEIAQFSLQYLLRAYEKTAVENKLLKKERKLLHRRISELQCSTSSIEDSSITSLTGVRGGKSSVHDYKCIYCKKEFMTRSFLQMHCRRRHNGQSYRDPVTRSERSLAKRIAEQGRQSVVLPNEIPLHSRGTSMGRQAGQMDLHAEKNLLALQKAWEWAKLCIRNSQDLCKHVLAEREANAPLLVKASDKGLGNRSAQSCLQRNCKETEVKVSIAVCGDEQECGPRRRPCSTTEVSTQYGETAEVCRSAEVPSKILGKGSSSFQQQIHAKPCYSNNQATCHKIHPGVYSRHHHSESIVFPAQDETRQRLSGKNFLLFVQDFDASLANKLQQLGIDFAKDTLEAEVCNKALHEVRLRVDHMVADKSAQQQGIYHEETRAMWKHLENIAFLHRTEDPSTKPVSKG